MNEVLKAGLEEGDRESLKVYLKKSYQEELLA